MGAAAGWVMAEWAAAVGRTVTAVEEEVAAGKVAATSAAVGSETSRKRRQQR